MAITINGSNTPVTADSTTTLTNKTLTSPVISDPTITGTTTNINTTNLVVEDKNIVINDVTSPTDANADGGGISLNGGTTKTLNWVDATDAWTSSENFNLASGKAYFVNGTALKDVSETLTNKTLTSPVISSISNTGTLTLPTSTGTLALTTDIPAGVVTETGTQTLSNKTLTSPIISSISNTGTITLPTTTGTLALTSDITVTDTSTSTLSNKTLTAPKFADLGFIADANGNELIILDTVASAVNEVTLANAATGGTPTLTASGGDTNISLDLVAKGTGTVKAGGVNLVTISSTDTLTNKTLTSPTVNTATIAGGTLVDAVVRGLEEDVNVVASAATGTINFDVSTASIWYYTSNATANHTLNFRYSSGASLDSVMATGDAITLVWLNTNGATPYYPNVINIDGSAVTPKVPATISAGNASAIDAYSFTIIKTASATFTVLETQQKFA
jgi:hypothetical protein